MVAKSRVWTVQCAVAAILGLSPGLFGGGGGGVGSQAPRSSETSRRPGAVSGIVRSAGHGEGVPNASVILDLQVAGKHQVMLTTTSESGRFVFMGVPPSSVITVMARRVGLVQGVYGQRMPLAPGRTLSLADGEWKADLSVPIWPTSAIEGRVTTDEGDPVMRVSVVAFRLVTVFGTRRFVQGPAAQTDDRGVYRIAGVLPGEYVLAVVSAQLTAPAEAAGRTLTAVPNLPVGNARALILGNVLPSVGSAGRLMYPTVFYPESPSIVDAVSVDVVSGKDRSGMDFRLPSVRAFAVSGRLQSQAATAAELTLRLVRASDRDLGSNLPIAVTRARSNGQFTFLGVPPGDYVIESVPQVAALRVYGASSFQSPDVLMPMEPLGEREVALPGVQPTLSLSTIERAGLGEGFWARESVSVVDADVADVMVPVRRAARLSGEVVFDSPTAVDRGPAGSVAATIGLTVRAEPADARVEALGVPMATVGRSGGRFVIVGVLPGEYVLRVGGRLLKSIEWNGQDVSDRPFEIDQADVDGVVLRVTEQSAVLEGEVATPDRRIADEATVLCFPVSAVQWTGYGLSPRRIKTTRVATSGRYRVEGLPAGEYFVVAVAVEDTDKWQDPAYLRAAARRAKRVTLDWNRVASVNLTRPDSR